MTIQEPPEQDHRGMAVVPVVSGDTRGQYTSHFKVNRALPNGGWETVLEGRCGERYSSWDAAVEAAVDTAKARIDRLLDQQQGSTA